MINVEYSFVGMSGTGGVRSFRNFGRADGGQAPLQTAEPVPALDLWRSGGQPVDGSDRSVLLVTLGKQ